MNGENVNDKKIHMPPQSVLYLVAKLKGIKRSDLKVGLKEKYGVDSSKDLTIRQYNEVMATLNALPEKEK